MGKSQRLVLSARLHELVPSVSGEQRVYFQPGPKDTLNFPCIVYELDDKLLLHADNRTYFQRDRYQVTYIDRSPDSDVPDKLAELPHSSLSRRFAVDGLNHYVFAIYP